MKPSDVLVIATMAAVCVVGVALGKASEAYTGKSQQRQPLLARIEKLEREVATLKDNAAFTANAEVDRVKAAPSTVQTMGLSR